MSQTRKYLVGGGLFALLFLFTQCSSSGSGSNEGSTSTSDDANTGSADAATLAVSDSVTGALGAMGGIGADLSALKLEGEPTEEERAEMEEEGRKSRDEHFEKCSFDEEEKSATCECEGGGTVSYLFEETVDPSELLISFSNQFRTVYSQCAVTTCEGQKTINGEVTGSLSGTYDESNGTIDIEATNRTAGECSGLTVGDVNVGLNITMHYDGTRETLNGQICFDPPGEIITFTTWEELMNIVNPDGTCRAAREM